MTDTMDDYLEACKGNGMIKKKSKLYEVKVNLLIEWDPSPIYLAPSLITSSSEFWGLRSKFSREKKVLPEALLYLNVGQVL